jgi:hypothetical protein
MLRCGVPITQRRTEGEHSVQQETYGKRPKTRAEKPLPAEGNKTIEEKGYASFGCSLQIEDPQEFFRESLFERSRMQPK